MNPSGNVRGKVAMPVTLPVGLHVVAEADGAGDVRDELHGEPGRAVPRAMPGEAADRLGTAVERDRVDRGEDTAVDRLDDPERHRSDLYARPPVLLERLEVPLDDEVGAEPLDGERGAGLLTAFDRRLRHPAAEALERRGGREGHRVGVRECRGVPRAGVSRVEGTAPVHVDQGEI